MNLHYGIHLWGKDRRARTGHPTRARSTGVRPPGKRVRTGANESEAFESAGLINPPVLEETGRRSMQQLGATMLRGIYLRVFCFLILRGVPLFGGQPDVVSTLTWAVIANRAIKDPINLLAVSKLTRTRIHVQYRGREGGMKYNEVI